MSPITLTHPRTYKRVRVRGVRSVYRVFLHGRCIGAVAQKDRGLPWGAAALNAGGITEGFPSRHDAAQWLEDQEELRVQVTVAELEANRV